MNWIQSSIKYMRSFVAREDSFQSSHSNRELIVRTSSTVMCSLRGSRVLQGLAITQEAQDGSGHIGQ